MSRYARQIAVPELGRDGHARLRAARVLIVGAGGLAAPVLPYLVGAGVGHIRLVDPDLVDETNLHRQTLFRMDDLGQAKAVTAVHHMQALNPDCVVEPVVAALDPANAGRLCDGVDLVLDCADSFAASYILSDTCTRLNTPLISASVVGMAGYCGGFCGTAPPLNAVFPDLPDRMESCAMAGVLGPVVGVIGTVQAQMALSVLAQMRPSPLGQLVTFDATTFRFGGFRFDGAMPMQNAPRFIAVTDIAADDLLIDMRPSDEPGPPLNGALRADMNGLATLRPDPAQRVVVACRSGLRAWHAANEIQQNHSGEIALLAMGDNKGETP